MTEAKTSCCHFGSCGGCQVFDLADTEYFALKRDLVVQALRAQRVANVDIAEIVGVKPRSRRRAALKLWVDVKGSVSFGFSAARSHEPVAISECAVLVPRLYSFAEAFARALPPALIGKAVLDLALTEAREGVDADLSGLGERAGAKAVAAGLLSAARQSGAVRLTHDGDLIYQTVPPTIVIDEVVVKLPARAFLQAVASASEAMTAEVVAAMRGAKRVVDLFSGLGTFALPMSRSCAIHAVESDIDVANALATAAGSVLGRKRVSVETRDLFRRPLLPSELDFYDGAVINPPFQGAIEQVRVLAKSKVARVTYVSCNPATFARDAAILCEGGYVLTRVVPVDQFLWSRQIELVAHFTRSKAARA